MTIDQAMESVARRVLNIRIIHGESRGTVQQLIHKHATIEGLTMGAHLAGIRSKFTEIEQDYKAGCERMNAMIIKAGKKADQS